MGPVPIGTTLVTRSSSDASSNQTYEGYHFVNGVYFFDDHNVTIRKSKITGGLHCDYENPSTNIVLEDVEIEGNAWPLSTFHGCLYTCIRCQLHGGAIFNMRNTDSGGVTIKDSVVYDITSAETGDSSDPCQHQEAIQLTGSGPHLVEWTRLIFNYHESTECEAGSGIIALYSHGEYWNAVSNVTMQHLTIESHEPTSAGSICNYMGSSGDRPDTENMIFRDVLFVGSPTSGPCAPDGKFTGWRRHNSNFWENVRWTSGDPISEPASDPY